MKIVKIISIGFIILFLFYSLLVQGGIIPSGTEINFIVPPTSIFVENSKSSIKHATLPLGFYTEKIGELKNPTAITFDDKSNLFVSTIDGIIYVLEKNKSNEEFRIYAEGFQPILGLAFNLDSSELFISEYGKITILSDFDHNLTVDSQRELVSDIPIGWHTNNNLKFGPDGMIYMGIGSTCDACIELNKLSASIVKIDPESGSINIIASGLRNPFDIAFHPETNNLYATDNGRDDLGPDAPHEELNHIIVGQDYGWPNCWDLIDIHDYCETTKRAIILFPPHSSVNNIEFYGGSTYPIEYQGTMFALVFGSYHEKNIQTGIYKITIPQYDNQNPEYSWFAKFPADIMPIGMAINKEGLLFFGDYNNGGIYKINYETP